MTNTNKILFNRIDYKNEDDFYEAVSKQIRLLVESNNVITFQESIVNKGMYALQFNSLDASDENITYPMWLTQEEILYVSAFANRRRYEQAKQLVEKYEDDDNWTTNNKISNNGGNTDA